jgi:hypothetical protein
MGHLSARTCCVPVFAIGNAEKSFRKTTNNKQNYGFVPIILFLFLLSHQPNQKKKGVFGCAAAGVLVVVSVQLVLTDLVGFSILISLIFKTTIFLFILLLLLLPHLILVWSATILGSFGFRYDRLL